MSLIEINNLSLSIRGTAILNEVSLSIQAGKITGLVGESGSGKSLTALSIMQLLPAGSSTSGEILFDGKNLLQTPESEMCRLRGDDIGMVFQEPMTALNPLQTIGQQIIEGIRVHTSASRKDARNQARRILDRVGLSNLPLNRYPHELSGGQRQRVVIAIACVLRPRLLIADEPTTALDVTVQAQILDLMHDLVTELNMGLILISHDLGVVAKMADELTILRNGKVVEQGNAIGVLTKQAHPYTRQLAEASTHVPAKTLAPVTRDSSLPPLLEARNLVCKYPGEKTGIFARADDTIAVDNVSFDILPGQTLGLVGESGCGKSTLARTILGLKNAAAGTIRFKGEEINFDDPASITTIRKNVQVVFQDPYGSFNPRHKVMKLVAEPLHASRDLSGEMKRQKVVEALESVGLSGNDLEKYPHEFSGGQRQRIAIARALITSPKLIIADEPVSALDVSVRAQILDLLVELRERLGLACLFISHDLSVVRAICDEVMVMKAGKILENHEVESLFENPQNEYTKTLIKAAPDLNRILQERR